MRLRWASISRTSERPGAWGIADGLCVGPTFCSFRGGSGVVGFDLTGEPAGLLAGITKSLVLWDCRCTPELETTGGLTGMGTKTRGFGSGMPWRWPKRQFWRVHWSRSGQGKLRKSPKDANMSVRCRVRSAAGDYICGCPTINTDSVYRRASCSRTMSRKRSVPSSVNTARTE